jgi:hypothetical protein
MPRISPGKPNQSIHEKKITTMPLNIDHTRNLPAPIVPQKPSFLQTMKEGVALGIGSSIGHRLVGGIMGPSVVQKPIVDKKQEEYEQCIKDNDDKIGCSHLLKTNY